MSIPMVAWSEGVIYCTSMQKHLVFVCMVLKLDLSSSLPCLYLLSKGGMKLQPLWGQVYGPNTLYTPTVERLLDMKPQVDCVGDLMKLTVHGREASFGSSLLIDRGLPLH